MKKLFLTLLTLNCVNIFCADTSRLTTLFRQTPEVAKEILSYAFSSHEAIRCFSNLKISHHEISNFMEKHFDNIEKTSSLAWKEQTFKLINLDSGLSITSKDGNITCINLKIGLIPKVRVLNTNTGELILETNGSINWSGDLNHDNSLISIYTDTGIKIFKLTTGELLNKDITDIQEVNFLDNFVVAGCSKTLYLLDPKTGIILRSITPNNPIISHRISQDMQFISIFSNSEFTIWDTNTGNLLLTLPPVNLNENAVFLANNIAIRSSNLLTIYNIYTGDIVLEKNGYISEIYLHANGIMTLNCKDIIHAFDTNTYELLYTIDISKAASRKCFNFIILTNFNNSISIYDSKSGILLFTVKTNIRYIYFDLSISNNEEFIAISSRRPGLPTTIINIKTGKFYTIEHKSLSSAFYEHKISSDSSYIAIYRNGDSFLEVFDLHSGKLIKNIKLDTRIYSIEFANNKIIINKGIDKRSITLEPKNKPYID